MSKPKLKLIGEDGNGFAIISRGREALRKAGYSKEDIEKYTTEATSGDYDHLLQVTMKWFEVGVG